MRLFKFIKNIDTVTAKELDIKASLLKENASLLRSYRLLDCAPYHIPACLDSFIGAIASCSAAGYMGYICPQYVPRPGTLCCISVDMPFKVRLLSKWPVEFHTC